VNRDAKIGGLIWCGLLGASFALKVDLSWIELLFLFAPLVIVPLGLELTRRMDARINLPLPERIARIAGLPAAFLAVASLLHPRGTVAAALAGGWLAFCGVAALGGIFRFARGDWRTLDGLCPAVAFMYLSVGGAWFVASRLGLTPLGFEEPIVLLTAVHFHFAGFAAPLLARAAGRTLSQKAKLGKTTILFVIVAWGVLVGPGLLAAGFVVGPRVKLLAALTLASSEIGLAIAFLVALRWIAQPGPRLLVGLSAAAVIFSMVLAATWALGEFPLQPFVHLEQMARLHGSANAFGFTFCGLLGWIHVNENNSVEGKARS
jgi:hypothetical protein